MKHHMGKCLFFVCLLLVMVSFVARQETLAQSNQLTLEKEQNWETYRVGGTCISGVGGNVFVADVDGDGLIEILTGGHAYFMINGSRTASEAPFRIWNWNGQNLTLEKSQNWLGSIGCVYAGDANDDGIVEIITGESITNSTGSYVKLRIWRWNNQELVLKASYEATSGTTSFGAVSVSDVDGDGKPEIITVGRSRNDTGSSAQLCVWHYGGDGLTLKGFVKWGASNSTSVNSVCVADLKGDGVKEIVTGGYANTLKNSSGQLRIWQWNGESFSLKHNEEWRLKDVGYGVSIAGNVLGNTKVNNVKVDDIDNDDIPEIITGGFAYDGEKIVAQLRIWNWNGQTLTLEKSQQWTTQDILEVKAISINDIDGDRRREIVTSGGSGSLGGFAGTASAPELAQLRVWNWDGTSLTLKQSQDWYIDEGGNAQNVASGDVDKDGVIEIVTVGCTYLGTLCDPDMRIWSVQNKTASPPYIFLGAVGIVAVIAIAATFFLMRKKRR